MKDKNRECLDFVLKHYQYDMFNPQQAIDKLNKKYKIKSNRKRIYFLTGLAVASLFMGVFITIYILNSSKSEMIHIISTNQIIEKHLPDSTKVSLYPNSSISYNEDTYTKDSRDITMSGKVYFDVKRDEKRDFEVKTKLVKIKVLGTKFQVTENSDDTEVFVGTGKISMALIDGSHSVILTKNESAKFSNIDNSIQIVEKQTNNPLAWATNEFIYENTPLSEVLKEIAEFYNVELYCTNLDQKLTATFGTESLENILELIDGVLDVKIEKK